MPGTHPRNAKLSVRWSCAPAHPSTEVVHHAGAPRPYRLISPPNDARLRVHHVADGRQRFDAISVRADDRPGRDAVSAIQARKRTTPARTLARRREVVQLAQEAADVQGWTLTADERTMIEAFAGDRETAR